MVGLNLVLTLIVFSILYAVQLYYNKSFLLKLLNVTVVVFIASAVYFTFSTYEGWPTSDKQHDIARVVSIIIQPPVKGVNDGAIYYWVLEKPRPATLFNRFFKYSPADPNTPRSYHLPYTPEGEKVFSDAQNHMDQGDAVYMSPPGQKQKGLGGQGQGEGQDQGDGGQGNSTTGNSQNGSDGESSPKDYNVPSVSIAKQRQYSSKSLETQP